MMMCYVYMIYDIGLPHKYQTFLRTIRVFPISSNFDSFLKDQLGYVFDYEYIQEGWIYEEREGIEIKLYQLLKVGMGDVSSAEPVRGVRWLCEIRSLCGEQNIADSEKRMNIVAKSIERSIKFSKIAPESSAHM